MSNHVRNRDLKRGGSRGTKVSRSRKSRSKTFKTEESANKYAESKGLKDFKLVNMKSPESKEKKIKIV